MATANLNPNPESANRTGAVVVPLYPASSNSSDETAAETRQEPSSGSPLQSLLAFLSLHEQLDRRDDHASARTPDTGYCPEQGDTTEPFTLNEVLQLVAERALAITGADGLAIALAEDTDIVLQAAAGSVRPALGSRIEHDSAFSGTCFRTARVLTCNDTDTDARVNLLACRYLGVRSMVAVPLCLDGRSIGVLEAFSVRPSGFDDADVSRLTVLAELVVRTLAPEDESRIAESAQIAAEKLEGAAPAADVESIENAPADQERVGSINAALVLARKLLEEARQADQLHPEPTELVQLEPEPEPSRMPSESEFHVKGEAPPNIEDSGLTLQEPAETRELEADCTEPETVPFPEPAMLAGSTRLSGSTILLWCIVVAAALAMGIWWSSRPSQLAHTLVGMEMPVSNPAVTPPKVTSAAPSLEPAKSPSEVDRGVIPFAREATDPDRKPRAASQTPLVTGIRHWSSSESTTVVVDLEDQVQYEAHRLADPDRIYFDLHDTQLASSISPKPIEVGDGLLLRVRMAQSGAGTTRIVLETSTKADFSVSLESDPYRLVIDVHKVEPSRRGTVHRSTDVTEQEDNQQLTPLPPPTGEDLQLQQRVHKMRVVVDAGHGGRDRGTVGRNGLLEKDLVLEIVRRLGKLLHERLGMEVIYTRQDDSYIPLEERAGIANEAQADLFISVHANYSDAPSARGVETYYTPFFAVPTSKDMDAPPAGGAMSAGAVSVSPANLEQRAQQSRKLAESVQRSLYGTLSEKNLGLRDRGIKEANFAVLTESTMPGILAEISFVSSPTDEQKLRSEGYREQVAEALYKGIARYAASSGFKLASERR